MRVKGTNPQIWTSNVLQIPLQYKNMEFCYGAGIWNSLTFKKIPLPSTNLEFLNFLKLLFSKNFFWNFPTFHKCDKGNPSVDLPDRATHQTGTPLLHRRPSGSDSQSSLDNRPGHANDMKHQTSFSPAPESLQLR